MATEKYNIVTLGEPSKYKPVRQCHGRKNGHRCENTALYNAEWKQGVASTHFSQQNRQYCDEHILPFAKKTSHRAARSFNG